MSVLIGEDLADKVGDSILNNLPQQDGGIDPLLPMEIIKRLVGVLIDADVNLLEIALRACHGGLLMWYRPDLPG